MIYPKELEELIEYFKKLPGIGEKSAERLAISLLDFSEDDINLFTKCNDVASIKKRAHQIWKVSFCAMEMKLKKIVKPFGEHDFLL